MSVNAVVTMSAAVTPTFVNKSDKLSEQLQWDIGMYVGSSTADQKYNLLTSCLRPDKNYIYPAMIQGKATRRFQESYLDVFSPWLTWSHCKQGAFCRCYVLFAADTVSRCSHEMPGVLVYKPMNKYKDAKSDCAQHASKKYHKDCCSG